MFTTDFDKLLSESKKAIPLDTPTLFTRIWQGSPAVGDERCALHGGAVWGI